MSQPAAIVAQSMTTLEDAILAQPDLVSEAITSNFDGIRTAAVLVAAARRVQLCGVGAAGHAAAVGEQMLRSVGVDARAAHAFDVANYPSSFDPGDLIVVVFQRDGKTWPARVLQRAIHSGLKTVAIATQGDASPGADVTIETIAGDAPSSRTSGSAAAMAVLAAIAARFEPRSPLAIALPGMRELVRSALPSREQAREVARVVSDPGRRVTICGAGTAFAVALAGAQALRESAALPVESMHLEDMLTCGILSLNPGDVLVQLAPSGPSDDRQADIATVANTIGVERWKIGGKPDGARWHTPLVAMPEIVTPIAATIPLQWLALECALALGVDPDALRRDDPRYAAALAGVSL